MKEEDEVDDEEDDDLTRQMLSNQFGRIHIIYRYIVIVQRGAG